MVNRSKRKKQSASVTQEIVVEIEKPTKFTNHDEAISGKIQIKPARIDWWLVGGFISLLMVVMVVSLTVWWYLSTFERAAGVPAMTMIQKVREGSQYDPFSTEGVMTIAILGLDRIQNRGDDPVLTDTMIIAQIRKDGQIWLLSLPRDLWVEAEKTKINALYTLGEENQVGGGEVLVKRVLREITGMPIDYVIVLEVKSVAAVVDALGGIELEVPRGFVDEKYPRENVDLNSQDPNVLYETFSVVAGRQKFDGETVVKYLRSRHSQDPIEGSDVGRMQRQQLVIAAIMDSLKQKDLLMNPKMIGSLYKVWHTMVVTKLNDETLIGAARQLVMKQVHIKPIAISAKNGADPGILKTVTKNRYGLWVYEPIDSSWAALQQYIKNQMATN